MRVFFWEGIEFKLKLLWDDDDKRQLKIKRAIVFFVSRLEGAPERLDTNLRQWEKFLCTTTDL